MKKILVAFALTIAIYQPSRAQNLVPKPVSVVRGEGVVTLIPFRNIEVTAPELTPLADYLAEYLPVGQVRLSLDAPEHIPAEGYRLVVAPERITIAGADYGGVWNGIQTLLQLFPAEVYSRSLPQTVTTAALTIEDWPAMTHRGVMLDVARTFIPLEQVITLIDNLSRHKINRLHWHLADDEGWRIEIKSHPRLTDVGAWRGGDSPLWAVYGAWDRKYGGFYTQDEIRRVIAYAATRNVEIIPEIDLPGHSRAAARAYPEILCDYTPSLTASAGYDTRNVFCVSREENYAMLDDIIGEVAALFPSETIHLGGDEVEPAQWSRCPHCKALMAERGITEVARLQDVFMERVIDIAASHGKRGVVWNEAAASGRIAHSTTVQAWENPAAGARKFAAEGYPTVVSSGEYFYFDMRQSPRDIGHIWAGIVTLQKVYSFDPAKIGFTPSEMSNLRGVEATLFTELGLENGPGYVDYQLFPRVCALAEVAWTPASERRWDDFESRLTVSTPSAPSHLERLSTMGIAYRAAEPVSADTRPLKTPAVVFTSSLPQSAKTPFSGVSSYKAAARMSRAPVEGDWFMWTFAAPLSAATIDLKTGYDHLQRAGVPQGRVEVSYDGRTFETVSGMYDLKATLELDPQRPIRALRAVCTSHGNGESFTLIQPLKIR
jgi:hexosaminidase